MDLEQEELQFLGLFGLYREAYKIVFSWKKIFSQITLALILPLSFIYLAHVEVSSYLYQKILINEMDLAGTQVDSAKYNKTSDGISTLWTTYRLFQVAYLVFTLIFSLLSTSAVVYTIGCIYTGRELTFKKVMSVVPRVWKRLMITFLAIFLTRLSYVKLAIIVVTVGGVSALLFLPIKIGIAVFKALLILYAVGFFLYLGIVWQLASVISVLEDCCGVGAMEKSRALIKGKLWVASAIFIKLALSLFVIITVFDRAVVNGGSLGTASRIVFAILCLLLLLKLFLFGFVLQTILYFVCKSYHHENIDKSALSDHLEVYRGEYVPLKSKDVQLEHYDV